jgi:mannose-6-phosphate isomerase-like protein (cupin superfamily)
MFRPIVRNIMEYLHKGEGYLLFGKVSGVARREAEVSESNVMTLKQGQTSSNVASHPDEEEIYYVVSGEGEVTLDGKTFATRAGSLVYIPRNCKHISRGVSKEDYVYVCVAMYFDLFSNNLKN